MFVGERFPKIGLAVRLYMGNGLASCVFGRFGYFVISIIGESALPLFFLPAESPPIAGKEHPMVGITHNTHEEWSHGIAVLYFVIQIKA
ncbi:MAG: hypothetical protein CR994_00780 [Maribacter sp.]|nr:MAG: hypothetical protein CR994_00780 [Maribacter sp.]